MFRPAGGLAITTSIAAVNSFAVDSCNPGERAILEAAIASGEFDATLFEGIQLLDPQNMCASVRLRLDTPDANATQLINALVAADGSMRLRNKIAELSGKYVWCARWSSDFVVANRESPNRSVLPFVLDVWSHLGFRMF